LPLYRITLSRLKVLDRPLDSIQPYPKNARKITQQAIDVVAKSLSEFGWQQPIVVDTAGVIIVGHTRWLAAKQLGFTHGPVTVAENLSAAQVRAYRLMDNKSHEYTGWEMELLGGELLELKGLDLDLSFTGFESKEYGNLADVVFREYDESVEGEVKYLQCPQCNHKWPA